LLRHETLVFLAKHFCLDIKPFVLKSKQFIFASKTQKNHGSFSKYSFLINAAAGREKIRVLFLDMRVQKLDSGDLGQRWNGFGINDWDKWCLNF